MTQAQLKILAKILDRAANEFSNHGCNDFDLTQQGLTPEELQSFKAGFTEYMRFDCPEYEGGVGNCVQDDCVMRYLRDVVETKLS